MPSADGSLSVFAFLVVYLASFFAQRKQAAAKISLILMTGYLCWGVWYLLLLTEGVKGMKLTFAFHHDSRWTGLYFSCQWSWYNDVVAEAYQRV